MGLALVMQNGKYGYIDKNGILVIPAQFESAFDFSEGLALVMQDGKYGYIDTSGKFVIPAQYVDAWNFSEGLAAVDKDGKWAYVDKTGKQVFPHLARSRRLLARPPAHFRVIPSACFINIFPVFVTFFAPKF